MRGGRAPANARTAPASLPKTNSGGGAGSPDRTALHSRQFQPSQADNSGGTGGCACWDAWCPGHVWAWRRPPGPRRASQGPLCAHPCPVGCLSAHVSAPTHPSRGAPAAPQDALHPHIAVQALGCLPGTQMPAFPSLACSQEASVKAEKGQPRDHRSSAAGKAQGGRPG